MFFLREMSEFILVAQRNSISRINLKNSSVEILPIKNLKNVIAIEFDMRNNCLYWAEQLIIVVSVICLILLFNFLNILCKLNFVTLLFFY